MGRSKDAELLRKFGIRPSRRKGQHFLFQPRLLEYVLDEAAVGEGDRVVEVGPGTGALTARILDRGASVTAVEIDSALCRLLRERFGGETRFRLIEGDALSGKRTLSRGFLAALNEQGGSFKIVANLPFGSATPLIMAFLETFVPGGGCPWKTAVVMVQKEVAERFAAAPRSKAYGSISVLAQLLARVEKLRQVSRGAFHPPPKVDAAVIRLTPRRGDAPAGPLYRVTAELVREAFAQRRKRLVKRLLRRYPTERLREAVSAEARAEELSPDQYLRAAEIVLGEGMGGLSGY